MKSIKWKRTTYRPNKKVITDIGSLARVSVELKYLKKENERLKEENEILKHISQLF